MAQQKPTYYGPTWGMEQMPFSQRIDKVKDMGFSGVEFPPRLSDTSVKEMKKVLQSCKLSVIGQGYTSEPTLAGALKELKEDFRFFKELEIKKCNYQLARDFYSDDDIAKLIEAALEMENKSGIRLCMETHRGRFTYSPKETYRWLKKFPEVKLTLDASHWCSVCENAALAGHQTYLDLAIKHTDHVHARIGHDQGAQVNDPQAPEWEGQRKFFLSLWKKVLKLKPHLSITPEFGPSPYQAVLPYTRQPIADQFGMNQWMLDWLKKKL